MTAAPPILELIGVRAAYGRTEVLHGVDLVVPRGAVLALLGPNGAGKSTLLKVIAGLLPATAGDVHLGGVHVSGATPEALVAAGLCLVPQRGGVFPGLTVEEHLRLGKRAGPVAGHALEAAFERFPRLQEHRGQRAGRLVDGEQQMLSLARALGTEPALLLLDELSAGVPAPVVDELYAVIEQVARTGVSIIIAEQHPGHALRLADYGAVMRRGRVVATGEPAELRKQDLGGAA